MNVCDQVLEEMDFTRLSKLRLPDVEEPQDLYTCGELLHYDKSYDRVSVKAEKSLKRINKEFHKVGSLHCNVCFCDFLHLAHMFDFSEL